MLSHKPVLFKCFSLFKGPGKAGLLLKFQVAKYSPLWGVAGDQVEMVVKEHCGTVLGDKFAAMLKYIPQNSLTMHLTTISTQSPARP